MIVIMEFQQVVWLPEFDQFKNIWTDFFLAAFRLQQPFKLDLVWFPLNVTSSPMQQSVTLSRKYMRGS